MLQDDKLQCDIPLQDIERLAYECDLQICALYLQSDSSCLTIQHCERIEDFLAGLEFLRLRKKSGRNLSFLFNLELFAIGAALFSGVVETLQVWTPSSTHEDENPLPFKEDDLMYLEMDDVLDTGCNEEWKSGHWIVK